MADAYIKNEETRKRLAPFVGLSIRDSMRERMGPMGVAGFASQGLMRMIESNAIRNGDIPEFDYPMPGPPGRSVQYDDYYGEGPTAGRLNRSKSQFVIICALISNTCIM